MKKTTKNTLMELVLYIVRWQASTPVLAVCLVLFTNLGTFWATVLANLVGSILFFPVDKLIFKKGEEDDE